jgi:hypothetical protein
VRNTDRNKARQVRIGFSLSLNCLAPIAANVWQNNATVL